MMRQFITALGIVAFSANCAAYDDDDQRPSSPNGTAQTAQDHTHPPRGAPIYRPPPRSAPGGRISGATRSTHRQQTQLTVLAPDHTGMTVRADPTLYWYMSDGPRGGLRMTIINSETDEPLYDEVFDAPERGGMYSFSLRQHGLQLAPRVRYRWIVSMTDPQAPGQPLLTSGIIEWSPSGALLIRDQARTAGNAAALYATNGLWYDAIDALSERIRLHPRDRRLREQRAALLDQVGLHGAAAFDRSIPAAVTDPDQPDY